MWSQFSSRFHSRFLFFIYYLICRDFRRFFEYNNINITYSVISSISFQKDFIGKAALLKQKKNGVHKKYIQLLVYNHNLAVDPWPQGGEVIYRDGEPAGRTTSAAYGFTLGCQVPNISSNITLFDPDSNIYHRLYHVCWFSSLQQKEMLRTFNNI